MSKAIEQAAQIVVTAIDSMDDAQDSIADAVRSVFAGVPKASRKATQTRFYAAIRAQYGAKFTVAQLKELANVGDLNAARIIRAYNAARKAVSRLFPKIKTRKIKDAAATPGAAIAIPLKRDGLREWLDAAVSAIQDAEQLEFDAAKMIAAFLAAREILS
jgi:hypothetical protein